MCVCVCVCVFFCCIGVATRVAIAEVCVAGPTQHVFNEGAVWSIGLWSTPGLNGATLFTHAYTHRPLPDPIREPSPFFCPRRLTHFSLISRFARSMLVVDSHTRHTSFESLSNVPTYLRPTGAGRAHVQHRQQGGKACADATDDEADPVDQAAQRGGGKDQPEEHTPGDVQPSQGEVAAPRPLEEGPVDALHEDGGADLCARLEESRAEVGDDRDDCLRGRGAGGNGSGEYLSM